MPVRSSFALSFSLLLIACPEPNPPFPDRQDAGSTRPDAGHPFQDAGPPVEGLTWHDDVAPIIAEHCQRCHESGGIAPFALTTFGEVAPMANVVADSMIHRRMPPFLADNSGECGTWREANWVSEEDLQIVYDWARSGAEEGEAKPPPEGPALPSIPEPDLTISMRQAYTPDANEPDVYRCFVLDTGLTERRFVTQYEVVPGDDRVVHHVILYAPRSEEAELEAEALASQDGEPGYSCYGGARVDSTMIAAWAPGTGATTFPEGTGLELPAERKLIMQMHYNTANGPFPDTTSIKMKLSANVPSPGVMSIFGHHEFSIPPGEEHYVVTGSKTVRQAGGRAPLRLWGILPHMHELGTTWRLERIRQGESMCMMDVKRWDFNWQLGYFRTEAIDLQPSDEIRITCTYDSRSRTEVTEHGDATEDEMCLAPLFVTQ